MQISILLISLILSAVVGGTTQQRILGGSATTINNYPFAAVILHSNNLVNFNQVCTGTILNNRSVLSAAQCLFGTQPFTWRIRVGSSFASSGGVLHTVSVLISHPNYNIASMENDVGIYRISSSFSFNANTQPGSFASANYNVADNQAVWNFGWGSTSLGGAKSEQLRHVQIVTVNQNTCRNNYNGISMTVTSAMICAGNLAQGGQAPCDGDQGGPLLHNGVVVGISSWATGCGYMNFPAVFTRVPNFIQWIQANS